MLQYLKKKIRTLLRHPKRITEVGKRMTFYEMCDCYKPEIEKLHKNGVFTLSNGSVEVNKDWEGNIRGKIKITKYV